MIQASITGFLTPQAVAAGPTPPYGLFSTAPSHGWGLRKLRSAYSGACLRVRRSSDGTESDIGFDGTELDVTALLAFVGATSSDHGYVVTLYDQIGSVNLVQSTVALMPLIVLAGSLRTRGSNSKPAMYFGSGVNLSSASTINVGNGAKRWMVSGVAETGSIPGSPGNIFLMAANEGLGFGLTSSVNKFYARVNGTNYLNFSFTGTSISTMSMARTANGGSNCTSFKDGSVVGSAGSTSSEGGAATFRFGMETIAHNLYACECIVWVGVNPGETDHDAHHDNASAYWGY